MKRAVRPAFVVTTLAVAACTSRTRKPTTVTDAGKPVHNLDYANLTPLNPRDDKKREIYASGEKCYVHVPFEEKQTSWRPPKRKQVDCPRLMDHAAWDQCNGGRILKAKDSGTCVCTRDGNPPPPPVEVTCPE